MKKVIILVLIAVTIFQSIVVSAEEDITELDPIEIEIFGNEGLTQFSRNNYTFDCEKAGSNILTIYVKQTVGYTYLSVTHRIDKAWVEQGVNYLDSIGSIYNIQFTGEGLYKLRVIRDHLGNSTYRDFFVNVLEGGGSFIGGEFEDVLDRARWIENMEKVYRKDDWTWLEFKEWMEEAARWFKNPAYIVTDFLTELPMFLLMPHTWFIIAIVVSIVIIKYRGRIHRTRKERAVSLKHGTRENIIREKRKAQEQLRERHLNTMPIDYALELHGSGDWKSRAYSYCAGSLTLGVTYPSAYSLAFELGGMLYSREPDRNKKAREIIDKLVEEHEPTLEKSYIYQDIAACSRALSAESVEPRARPIIKDDLIKIAESAEEDARNATEELSRKLKIRTKAEKGVSEGLKDIESKMKKGKGGDKSGKGTITP